MEPSLRILIVEDSADDTDLLVHYLKQNGFDISYKRVYAASTCKTAMCQEQWDLVIADYSLPGFSGMEALAVYKENGLDMPFIIVSGTIGEDVAVEAMKAGAHDYILKDNLARLAPAIRRELRDAQVRREHRRAEQALRESEAMYRTLFENSGTALVFIEADMTVSLINKEMEKLIGYPRSEIEGKRKWKEFIPRQDDLARLQKYSRLLRQKPGIALDPFEFQLGDRAGKVKDVVAKIVMIPGTTKSLTSVLDITARKQAENALSSSLKEKEFLLQELNHRVNNNLQLISNLLRMQGKHITDKKAVSAFNESQNRIRSIALVHEKLYMTRGFYDISMREYIEDLTKHIFESFTARKNQIELALDVEDVPLDIERVIACGLIINELLSNSLKYAFPGRKKGTIAITLRHTGAGKIEIICQDNGIGMPEGLDIREAKSLGMQLIVNLAEKQLEGVLETKSGKGAYFKIIFRQAPAGQGS